MSFLTTPSLTRRTVANHFPCIRGNATCFPGSRGRRLASRQLFRELTCTCAQFVCCHVDVFWISTVTDNFWRKSSWKSGRRTFHVSYFAWVAAEANLFSREPTKAAFHGFPRLHEKTGSFSEYEKPASCTQYTQWAAWADTQKTISCPNKHIGGGDWKHRKAIIGIGDIGLALSEPSTELAVVSKHVRGSLSSVRLWVLKGRQVRRPCLGLWPSSLQNTGAILNLSLP